MNERIRRLLNEATSGLEPDLSKQRTVTLNEMEKFAELIINECIDQVAGTKIVGQFSGDEITGLSESADNKYKQWNNALVIATMNVRDHFGVKE